MHNNISTTKQRPLALHDIIFDVVFFVLTVISFYVVHERQFTQLYLACIVTTSVLVVVVGKCSFAFGQFLSSYFLSKPPFNNPLKPNNVAHKFSTQSWQLFIHTSMSSLALYVVWDEEWASYPESTAPWFLLGIGPLDEKFSLKLLYIIQLSIWVVTCFCHRFIDKRTKDYYVVFTHHVVTIAIVSFSLYLKYTKYGVVFFLLHDLSDFFLDLLRIFNYLKLEGPAGGYLVEIFYGSLMVVWTITRLYLLPRLMIRGAYLQAFDNHIDKRNSPSFCKIARDHFPEVYNFECRKSIVVGLALYGLLQLLHVYWTILLMRIGYRAIIAKDPTTGSVNDVGKDMYEGDDDDDNPTPQLFGGSFTKCEKQTTMVAKQSQRKHD